MKFPSLLSTIFFLVFISGLQPLQSQPTAKVVEGISLERLAHLDHFIEKSIEENNIPGAVALVSRNGKMVHQAVFGHRDKADRQAMGMNDIFFIQSMTKPIITVAFMMLYEEGHFLLTDPVSKYLPAFKDLRVAKDVDAGKAGETEPLERPITIAHLLTHTAGLSHGLGGSKLDREIYQDQYGQIHADITARVNSLLKMPLMGQPGEQWYYSTAPDVLSVLIEHFSGMSTNDFLEERIFEPLEMHDTRYNLSPSQQTRMVQLHQKNEEGTLVKAEQQKQMEGNTIWSGVNALFSSASDYLNFCQMLLNGGEWNGRRLLSRKTVELMTVNHTGDLYDAPGKGFGLGFAVVDDLAGGKLLASEGLFHWSGAYNTHFFIDPKEKMIAVFMTQVAPYTDYYHEKLRQLVYQAVVD